ASDADVRVIVKDRVVGEVGIALNERGRQLQLQERLPDRLMKRQRMRVDDERVEQMLESIGRLTVRGQELREREPGSPILWVAIHEAPAERRKPLRVVRFRVCVLEPPKCQVRAIRRRADESL